MIESRELIFTDDLTKVFNRRFLLAQVKKEKKEAEKTSSEFSVLLLDIDHFKIINDSFGHLAGDETLRHFAGFLKDSFRKSDIVCRYAGDEFVIIIPHSSAKKGIGCSERFIKRLAKKEFSIKSVGSMVKLSVSIGVASFPDDGTEADELFDVADKGLYKAKAKGGNVVVRDRKLKEPEENIVLNFAKFIGRDDTLSLIKSRLETVLHGKEKVLFITGAIGIGKTRLVKEAMQYAELIGFRVFDEKAISQEITSPYFLFRSLIKNIIETSDPKIVKKVMDKIAIWRQGLVWFLPDLFKKKEGEAAETKGIQKHYLFEAIAKFLIEISKYKPIFLFFDNLQWVDDDDIEVLGYVIRNFVEEKIFIVGAYRESEIDEETHPLKHLIYSLSRDGLIEKMELGPLSIDEVKELASTILGIFDFPLDIIEFINETTEGNCLFIEEVLKILVEKDYIYKTGQVWNFLKVKEMILPERISDILKGKIESLNAEARNLLMAASVVGEQFSLADLKYITGNNEGYLIDLLDSALKKSIIFEGTNDVGEYRFTYRILQNVFYNLLTKGKKSIIHRKVGEMLESLPNGKEENMEKLAYHFRNAGLNKKAFSYYLSYAEKTENIMAYQKAIEMYLEAVKLAKKLNVAGKPLFNIYYKLAYLYMKIGKLSRAEEYLLGALKFKGMENNNEAMVLHKIGNIYMRRGRYEKAIEYYEKAKPLFSDKNSAERVMLNNDEADVYINRGVYTKAFEIAQDALDSLSEECVGEKARIYNTLGNACFYRGRLDEAFKFYNKSLDIAKKCSNEDRVAIAYKNIGRVFLEKGKKGDAERFFRISLGSAEKVGNLYLMWKVYNDIGVLLASDDPEESLQNYLKSLDITKRIGDDNGVAIIFNNIGNLYLRSGEIEKALPMFREALRIWKLIGMMSGMVIIYLNLGKIYFLSKNFEKSFYYLFEAKDISNKIGYVNGEISSIIHLSYQLIENERMKAVNELLDEAEKLNEIYQSDDYAININLQRARFCLAKGDINGAKKHYDYIVENISKIGDRDLEEEVEVFSGRFSMALGKFTEAMKYFERALNICDVTGYKLGLIPIFYYEALLLRKEGEIKKAESLLKKAKQMLENSNVKVWFARVDELLKEIGKLEH